MNVFESETALLRTIWAHDELVRKCVRGETTFGQFCQQYNDFYAFYALDGHESDEDELELFLKHEAFIDPHRVIAYYILGRACSDSDAELDSYKQAARFGSAEAVRRLSQVRLGSPSRA